MYKVALMIAVLKEAEVDPGLLDKEVVFKGFELCGFVQNCI